MRDAQTSRGRPWPLTLLTGFGLAALLALACSPPGEASTLPKDNLATAPTTAPADASAVRLASDLFVSVGEQHRIDGFGELIEALYVTGPPALAVSDDAVVAEAGGISCLQFRYREVEQENAIQAQCVMAFDETGSRAELERVTIGLLTYLDGRAPSDGDANLLASGSGRFYAVCRAEDGAYRLRQPYLQIVDSLGNVPYSPGDDELPAQRAGTIDTFGGESLQPPWIVSVSREIEWIELTRGGFKTNSEDCSTVPSCSTSTVTVRTGDLLRVSVVLGMVSELAKRTDPTILDAYLQDRIGL